MFDELRPTAAERVYVWRKREELNQSQMAAKFDLSRVRWGKWERGEETPTIKVIFGPEDIQDYERCALLRRRACMTQSELAKRVGVSRWWLIQMEAGKAPGDKLVEYWKEAV